MGSDVKRFLRRLTCFILVIALCTGALFLTMTKLPSAYFRGSYQYAINLKYDHMMRTESPKIIIVGGSNCGFGINEILMEARTGMPVCNMGLHASFGGQLNTEFAFPGVGQGDLVVLCNEYGFMSGKDSMSAELAATGFEDNYHLYGLLSAKQWLDVIRYFPTYLFKKLEMLHEPAPEGVYSLSSFDPEGRMIFDRPACVLPAGDLPSNYGDVGPAYLPLDDDIVEYLNDFARRVRERGGQVLLSFPCILDERMGWSDADIAAYERELDERLDFPRISEIKNYCFPRVLMYDTIFHCNNDGVYLRSEKLASDINAYLEETHVPE